MNIIALTADSYSRSRRYLKHGPMHLVMYVLGRFSLVRSWVVWTSSLRAAQPRVTSTRNHAENINVEQAALDLEEDGFSSGFRLRPEVLKELLAFASMANCFGDGDLNFPFRYSDRHVIEQQTGKRFQLGRYNHALQASPVLQNLAADPELVAIARKYLHTEPVFIGARMWWSFAREADLQERKNAGQGFHYDIDGYRGVAFFFYLTDVSRSNGPHVFVRGSHTRKLWRHLVSLYKSREDAEIDRVYGRENQIVCCGPAGSGFAEDLFGFHKGSHPDETDRLVVQLRYGIRDYGTGHGD